MKTILLVEDDMFISDMIETKLCQSDFNVVKTADGESVLKMIAEHNPDLVLLDLMLPNVHGFEVLKQVRSNPETEYLPVIVLSNENGTDVEEKAKLLNAKYYFKAMTDINELVPIINETIS